jgi:ribonuclease HI
LVDYFPEDSNVGWTSKKRFEGPCLCIFCKNHAESIDHLFISCVFTKKLWVLLKNSLKLKRIWSGQDITDAYYNWITDKTVPSEVAALTCWFLWIERNRGIFENKRPSVFSVMHKVMGLFRHKSNIVPNLVKECFILHEEGTTIAFFDGAARSDRSSCGAGGVIKISEILIYRWFFNCGGGTNSKAELLGIWASLFLANFLGIQRMQAFGDSKVIIEWLNEKGKLDIVAIEGWKKRTKILCKKFQALTFHHIFREFNKEADTLSKEALLSPAGRLTFYQWEPGGGGETKHLDIF